MNDHHCRQCGRTTSTEGINNTCPACLLEEGLQSREAACSSEGKLAGQMIGRYFVIDQIGEGGMGEVYLAEQETPVRREVALKVIKTGMASDQAIARFEAERQSLAAMDHPGIAKIYDAGSMDGNRPWLAMELVEGIPIHLYCRKHRLDLTNVLQLILELCRAIQHAHRNGVIHRDLKPSNVLVAEEEGRPIPKVIDFGVAKALRHSTSGDPLQTFQGQMLGTPAYMSPEQARGQSTVDTRSDIYSLGILLYEVFTGKTTFDTSKLKGASLSQLERTICEEVPLNPCSVAANFPKLPDELGWIVMKAIEKEPDRRYQTVAELIADIERHLANQPVLAGPPTISYKVSKFIHRHRTGAIAAVLVSSALLLTIVVAVFGLFQAMKAEHAEESAMAEAETAAGVIDFFQSVIYPVPIYEHESIVGELSHRLNEFASRLEEEAVPDDPHPGDFIEWHLTASLYLRIGEYDSAERCFLNAQRVAETLQLPTSDERVHRMRSELGQLYMHQHRFADAEKLIRDLLKNWEAAKGLNAAGERVQLNFDLANSLSDQGKTEEAAQVLEQSLQQLTTEKDAPVEMSFSTKLALSDIYASTGKPEKAEALLRATLSEAQQLQNVDTAVASEAAIALAQIRRRRGDRNEARALLQQALRMNRTAYGDEHPETHRIRMMLNQR